MKESCSLYFLNAIIFKILSETIVNEKHSFCQQEQTISKMIHNIYKNLAFLNSLFHKTPDILSAITKSRSLYFLNRDKKQRKILFLSLFFHLRCSAFIKNV